MPQNLSQVLQQSSRAIGLELNTTQLEAMRRALCLPAAGSLTLFRDADTLLGAIHRLGLGCALVSNASVRTDADYREDFAGFGLAACIDACVSSVDVGIRKPDPRLFEAALSTLGCSAMQAVVVGNSEPNDIEPARRLGARTIRVAIEEPKPLSTAADAVATNLADVADILLMMATSSSEVKHQRRERWHHR
jgi:HAD superfamily hydrolase (TIGR01509 family)